METIFRIVTPQVIAVHSEYCTAMFFLRKDNQNHPFPTRPSHSPSRLTITLAYIALVYLLLSPQQLVSSATNSLAPNQQQQQSFSIPRKNNNNNKEANSKNASLSPKNKTIVAITTITPFIVNGSDNTYWG